MTARPASFGFSKARQLRERDRLQIQQGSLCPALYRLEYRGLIKAEWGESDNNRKAKYYQLTAEGRRQLKVETENWNRLSAGVVGVLNAEPERS